MSTQLDHEQVAVRRGARSGVPVVIAVHSTVLGQAIGGCRLARYPRWQDAVTDALRLSAGMTDKCAVAGLPHGGGKTVVALPPGADPDPTTRRAILHDVADAVAALDGAYATGPDVGTDPIDMATIFERTPYAFCRPVTAGGSGDSSPHTATGVIAALHAVCDAVFGSALLTGRRFAIVGLGSVGAALARQLASVRARLVVSDIDPAKRRLADELGAAWLAPEQALRADVDVLVPAALGGVLTADLVPELRCAAIAGPANNQLDEPATGELLHARGVLWAPDYVVSAGGVVHATGVELRGESGERATGRVLGIADTLSAILRDARRAGVSPAEAAGRLARQRLTCAGTGTGNAGTTARTA